MIKKTKSSECPTLEVPDPVCQRSIYPPIGEFVDEATALALCGVKPSITRERSHEWLQVVRGQTYRQPAVLINNWFDEGQDIVHLRREKCMLSDVRSHLTDQPRSGVVYNFSRLSVIQQLSKALT